MSVLHGPERALPEAATVADLVEATVARTPRAPAVITDDAALTYAELDARANRLAHHLQRRGVGADVPVGVCLDRSPGLAVALLAALKAGGACLPLDPAYPPARLADMLADAAAPVIVTRDGLAAHLPPSDAAVVRLDADAAAVAGEAATPPPRAAGPAHLAYLIYTSGSTGTPKGVELTHRGLINHHLAVADLFALAPTDRVVQFCSISFDVSIEELFPTWVAGAAVVLRPDERPVLGAAWLEWLRWQHPTVLNLPTAYWHEWVRDLHAAGEVVPDSVRLVVVGGERAHGAAYRTWRRVGGDRVRWVNAYGPAETSVLATAYEPAAGDAVLGDHARDGDPADDDAGDPPIGRPLANTTVAVVDDHGRPVPPGQPGELHIAGPGVARGYRNRPELTAQHFLAGGIEAAGRASEAGDRGVGPARRYATGDRVRLRGDGHLEFLGRLDEQVKVRGFRIECRDVETHLDAHPAVAEAAATTREDRPGDRRLIAYVVADAAGRPTAAELRDFLGRRLPPYMVPSAFVGLDALPRAASGKLDRDALPAPGDPRRDLPAASTPPRTATEEAVAGTWARILDLDGLGAHDDFFVLGGHSLQATQAVAWLRETFSVDLTVGELFDHPTVAGLAAAIDRHRPAGAPPPLAPQPREPGQALPLTLSQEQMWRLETTTDPPGLFNVTAWHRFDGRVDVDVLDRALACLAARHEPLRTSVHADDGQPTQTVAAEVPVELGVTDLRPGHDASSPQLRSRLAAQDAAAFALDEAPLWRAHVYRLDDADLVAATFDHLVCDGTSAYVFLTELAAAYHALADGQEPSLRPLPVGYGDFAVWQRRWVTEAHLDRQLAYWRGKLAGAPVGPAIPCDRVPDRPTHELVTRSQTVPATTYAGLQRLARATASTVFVVCVAAVQALCARLGGCSDVVLSTTLSGRQHAELEGLVGCFHGIGRLRTDLAGDPPVATAVARARQTVLELFAHQDIPFMRVRRALMPDFPAGGSQLLASVPIDFQYFHTAHDAWAPGAGVVERPDGDTAETHGLFFRGQLHPLSLTLLDDRRQLHVEVTYKADFYDHDTIDRLMASLPAVLDAAADDPDQRVSDLPVK